MKPDSTTAILSRINTIICFELQILPLFASPSATTICDYEITQKKINIDKFSECNLFFIHASKST